MEYLTLANTFKVCLAAFFLYQASASINAMEDVDNLDKAQFLHIRAWGFITVSAVVLFS